jgi:hypothetical protein
MRHTNRNNWRRPFLITGIAITLAGIPSMTSAQDRDPGQSSNPGPGVNISQEELRSLDQFMDGHPEMARQLQANPGLTNDPEYLRANPDLRDYLQQHPLIQSGLRENANYFLHREDRFDARQDGRNDRARNDDSDANRRDDDYRNRPPDPDAARRALQNAKIDQFLQDHSGIDKDLRGKPDLVNDDKYLKKHEDLRVFLASNPDIRDNCEHNPAYFEDRDLRARMLQPGDSFSRGPNPVPMDGSRRAELVAFNQFLDSHREIAEQVRRDPSLADNREFVQNHPALQAYLQQNSEIRDMLRQDPNRVVRFDSGENHDFDREGMASFRDFLGTHPRIAEDISKEPRLVRDHDYVQKNPDLDGYLKAHPDVRDRWTSDPENFVKGAQQVSGPTTNGNSGGSGSPSSTGTPGSHTSGTGAAGTSGSTSTAPAPSPRTHQ